MGPFLIASMTQPPTQKAIHKQYYINSGNLTYELEKQNIQFKIASLYIGAFLYIGRIQDLTLAVRLDLITIVFISLLEIFTQY